MPVHRIKQVYKAIWVDRPGSGEPPDAGKMWRFRTNPEPPHALLCRRRRPPPGMASQWSLRSRRGWVSSDAGTLLHRLQAALGGMLVQLGGVRIGQNRLCRLDIHIVREIRGLGENSHGRSGHREEPAVHRGDNTLTLGTDDGHHAALDQLAQDRLMAVQNTD